MKDNLDLDKFLGYIVHHQDKALASLKGEVNKTASWWAKPFKLQAIDKFYPLFVKGVNLMANKLNLKVATAEESDGVEAKNFQQGVEFMIENKHDLMQAMDDAYKGNFITEKLSDLAIHEGFGVVLQIVHALAKKL